MDKLKIIGFLLIGVNLTLLPFSPVPLMSGVFITLLFFATLFYLISTKEFKLKATDIGILFWILTIFISCIFSINARNSFYYFEKLILKPLALYLGIRTFITSDNIEEVLTILSITYSSYGIVSIIYGDFSQRFTGLTTYPTILGKILDLMIPIVASSLAAIKNKAVIVVNGIGLIALITALIASMTRGAWIATGLALMVISIYILLKNKKGKYLIFLSIIVLFLSFTFIPNHRKEILKKRFSSVLHLKDEIKKDPSLIGRLRFYKTSIHLIKKKPIIGWGFGRKTVKYINERLTPEWFEKRNLSLITSHTHNTFLQILLETGIMGLIGFLLIIFLFFYESFKIIKTHEKKLLPIGLILSIIAILTHGLVTNILQAPIIYMFFSHIALTLSCKIEA